MDFKSYSTSFTKKARKSGYSQHQIDACLNYAEKLYSSKVPVIYNTDHLSVLVGYNKVYLKRAVSYPNSFYRSFYIKKRNNGRRKLFEPLPSLKEIQSWILNNVLYNLKVHPYCKAYSPKVTIRENVRFHKKKEEVLVFDIKNFFDSIGSQLITNIFLDIGYSPIISDLLTKLTTLKGRLSQGSPTSPYLSNLVMRSFDKELEKFSKENKLMATRYADDITFSSKEKIDVSLVTDFVKLELKKLGLKINIKKTRLMPRTMQQIVTGIVVNVKSQIPRKQRKVIRQEVYYIKKFGLLEHSKKRNITKNNYLKHLLGKVNYALFINPEDSEMSEYKKFLYDLDKKV